MSGLLNIGSRAASVRSCHKNRPYSSFGSSSATNSPRHSAASTVSSSVPINRKFSGDSAVSSECNAIVRSYCQKQHSQNKLVDRTNSENSSNKNGVPVSLPLQSENQLFVPSDAKRNSKSAPTSPVRSLRSEQESLDKSRCSGEYSSNFEKYIKKKRNSSPKEFFRYQNSLSLYSGGSFSDAWSLDDVHWETETIGNTTTQDHRLLQENSETLSTSSSFVYSSPTTRFRRNSFTPSTSTLTASLWTSASSFEKQEGNPTTNSSSTSSSPTSLTSYFGLREYYHQIAVDDRRELFAADKLNVETGGCGGSAIMASYGSIAYQMRDANIDSTSTFDFVYKAFKILGRTVLTTVLLVLSMAVPVLMVIIGVQFLHDCPVEPHIPIYLLVGGLFGTLKGMWLICQQVRSRRYERIDDAFGDDGLDEIFSSISYRATDVALTIFLLAWFGLGNYWVYRIYLPKFEATLFEPNDWCSETVYLFAIAQLIFIYAVTAIVLLITICLSCWQRCVTCFGEQYK